MARTFATEIFPNSPCSRTCASRPRSSANGYRARPSWITLSEKNKIGRLVDETLQLVGLEAKASRLVGELAHGDQRAAEVAMALSLRPHLLLLDEPTAGMGDQETYEITKLIRRAAPGAAISPSSSSQTTLRVVFHLADKITVLDRGPVSPRDAEEHRRDRSRRCEKPIWGSLG